MIILMTVLQFIFPSGFSWISPFSGSVLSSWKVVELKIQRPCSPAIAFGREHCIPDPLPLYYTWRALILPEMASRTELVLRDWPIPLTHADQARFFFVPLWVPALWLGVV